jgi:hypothetical protein
VIRQILRATIVGAILLATAAVEAYADPVDSFVQEVGDARIYAF